jgi:hypothetical protein
MMMAGTVIPTTFLKEALKGLCHFYEQSKELADFFQP